MYGHIGSEVDHANPTTPPVYQKTIVSTDTFFWFKSVSLQYLLMPTDVHENLFWSTKTIADLMVFFFEQKKNKSMNKNLVPKLWLSIQWSKESTSNGCQNLKIICFSCPEKKSTQ